MLKLITNLISLISSCFAINWLHISDIHVDMKYFPGSASECILFSKLGTNCCRFGDIPSNNSKPCSKWGNIHNDIPPLLFSSLMEWINNKSLNFDFIINTGDSGSHKDIEQVISGDNLDSINFVSETVNKYFPKKPVYNIIGNHDSYPNVDQTFPGYKNFLNKVTQSWNKWINDKNMNNFGYYSKSINNTNIQIIAMNSLYYDSHNIFQVNSTLKDKMETNLQFDWLENEFNISRINNKTVLFLNHIPLYGSESNNYMNNHLSKILKQNADIIIANLYGHSHKSRFNLYKNSKDYIGFGLINPSVYTDNDYPSFRIFSYNDGILNFDEYFCNLNKIIKNDRFECEYSYNFLSEYNLNNINLENLINLYENFKYSNEYFDKYLKHYSPPNYNKIKKIDYLQEIIVNYI